MAAESLVADVRIQAQVSFRAHIPRTRQAMKVHLYSSPNGRIVAVDNCDKARDLLPAYGPPAPMFDGQPVSYSVARACIREYGGMWLRADGLRRFKPGARANQTTGIIRA